MNTREEYLATLDWFKDIGSMYISLSKEYAYDDVSKIIYSRCECCGGLEEITTIGSDMELREIMMMLKYD